MKSITIAITLGDPGGIGPEVTVKAIREIKKTSLGKNIFFVLVGSLSVPEHFNKKLRANLKFTQLNARDFNRQDFESGRIAVCDPDAGKKVNFSIGEISSRNGHLALKAIDLGVDICLKGLADALVTAPVNKAAIQKVLPSFDGHTDYLKSRAGAKRVAMMFIAGKLKMSLVTMHLPLKRVSHELSKKKIIEKIELTYETLKHLFSIKHPRIGVSALNPHGGEFGIEEKSIIAPAVRQCKRRISNLAGPIPGDEIFRELWEGKWDAVVAMYHDQGLAPFKMIAFYNGVNLTVGLPFIRTSPDHGTAFDIAYQNKADHRPMLAAIELAIKLSSKK